MSSYRFGPKGLITDNILEPLLNSLPDIIHSVDKEGKIVFTNKKASELLGYKHEELIGSSIFDLYAPELRSKVKKGFQTLQEKGGMTIRESLLATKTGELIPVEIRSFGVYDEKGEFIRTFSMLRDIRAIKEMRDNMMHSEIFKEIEIECDCFGFEPEITAKIARKNCRIYEVPISYQARRFDEGKKIGWIDGLKAIYYIFKFNLFR